MSQHQPINMYLSQFAPRPQQENQVLKLLTDATQQQQLQQKKKQQLQQIAKDLNIQEKKKEEIIKRIPQGIFFVIQNDLTYSNFDQIRTAYKVFQNDILLAILKSFMEKYSKIVQPQIHYMPQQSIQNMYYYVIIPSIFYFLSKQLNPLLMPNYYKPQNQFINPTYQTPFLAGWEQPQPPDKSSAFCPCKVSGQKRSEGSFELRCVICDQRLHSNCLKVTTQEFKNFECPECTLSKLDPVQIIYKTIVKPVLMNSNILNSNFVLTNEEYQLVSDKLQYHIEIRSIRVDAKYMYETTWPDFCEIFLNSYKIHEFKPLKSNSSLKKRKDDPLILGTTAQNAVTNGHNNLIIKDTLANNQNEKNQFKLSEDSVYAFAVYIIKKRSPQEFISFIKDNKHYYKGKDDCINMIKQSFQSKSNTDQEVQIQKISQKVSFRCQFDCVMIKTPARGRFCIHAQCFSLENTITMTANCVPKKWKCPICKTRIFDIFIDSYQLELLNSYRNNGQKIQEISFDQEGNIQEEIFEKDESSDEDVIKKIVDPTLIQQKQPMKSLIDQNFQLQHQFFYYPNQLDILKMQQQLSQQYMLDPKTMIQNLPQQKQNLIVKQKEVRQQQPYDLFLIPPTKPQLKQLLEKQGSKIQDKVDVLTVNLEQKSILNNTKPLSFNQFMASDEIPLPQAMQAENDDKINLKNSKMKEKIVKVIKKQFYEFIRKNFGTIDNPKSQQQQTTTFGHNKYQHFKKQVYKLSEIDENLIQQQIQQQQINQQMPQQSKDSNKIINDIRSSQSPSKRMIIDNTPINIQKSLPKPPDFEQMENPPMIVENQQLDNENLQNNQIINQQSPVQEIRNAIQTSEQQENVQQVQSEPRWIKYDQEQKKDVQKIQNKIKIKKNIDNKPKSNADAQKISPSIQELKTKLKRQTQDKQKIVESKGNEQENPICID